MTTTTIHDFVALFREQEEELESVASDYVARVKALLQGHIETNRLGAHYSPEYASSISRPEPLACGTKPKKKKLEERTNALLMKRQAEETMQSKEAAEFEAKLYEEEEHLQIDLDGLTIHNEMDVVHPLCDQCDMRHSQEERECELCEQTHSGCCEDM